MRRPYSLALSLAVLGACADAPPPVAPQPAAPTPVTTAAVPSPAAVVAQPTKLTADTPLTTSEGTSFYAPAGWTVTVRGTATIVESPEGDSRLVVVDARAKDADAAVAAAWAAYKPELKLPIKSVMPQPAEDGWADTKDYAYQTSPNERRDVDVLVQRAGDVWTALVYDVSKPTADKRGAAIQLVYDRLLPKGYARESFAGKKANTLDAARVGQLTAWTERAMKELGIPGVALGIVQDGKVVYADGLGVRELGKPEKPNADTLFMIASNTKALTTLLLATLVDDKKLTWDTPVVQLLPTFKLGDDDITRQVLVRHLVCACTGLPRQDLEWIFQYEGVTPAGALATLATVKPTSKFGEMFQYSNLMAGAAGFVAGHVVNPKMELGAAYDDALRARVLGPLGMKSTTFDAGRALAGNHASPHAPDIDGRPARASVSFNGAIVPLRPAGGAWSNVHDMLAYVSMELAEGALPNGKRLVSREALLERRKPQVPTGKDETYGMALGVNTKYVTPVVHHGGDLVGFHSDMIWLPEYNVGAVVLTNGNPGWALRDVFQRKLLEVLFDGKSEADGSITAKGKSFFAYRAGERKLDTVPADPSEVAKLAKSYQSEALGGITVSQSKGVTTFDFGEWRSEVASRKNPDGTVSYVTIAPGVDGFEFVVKNDAKRGLVVRDEQHEYLFTER